MGFYEEGYDRLYCPEQALDMQLDREGAVIYGSPTDVTWFLASLLPYHEPVEDPYLNVLTQKIQDIAKILPSKEEHRIVLTLSMELYEFEVQLQWQLLNMGFDRISMEGPGKWGRRNRAWVSIGLNATAVMSKGFCTIHGPLDNLRRIHTELARHHEVTYRCAPVKSLFSSTIGVLHRY